MKSILRSAARRILRTLLPPGARSSLKFVLALEDQDRKPELISDVPQRRVLVLAPHMDDESAGCGGAMRCHADAGAKLTVVFMTDGRMGAPHLREAGLDSQELARAEEQLVSTRKQEARAACEMLGVSKIHFLDAPDAGLKPEPDIVSALLGILREERPELVYAPSVMDLHGDHWETNRVLHAVLQGLEPSIREPLLIRGYEIWTPVYANRVLEIDEFMEIKAAALGMYESQIEHLDYVRVLRGLNAFRSIHYQYGRGYAEAFFEATPAVYDSLFRAMVLKTSGV